MKCKAQKACLCTCAAMLTQPINQPVKYHPQNRWCSILLFPPISLCLQNGRYSRALFSGSSVLQLLVWWSLTVISRHLGTIHVISAFGVSSWCVLKVFQHPGVHCRCHPHPQDCDSNVRQNAGTSTYNMAKAQKIYISSALFVRCDYSHIIMHTAELCWQEKRTNAHTVPPIHLFQTIKYPLKTF